MLLQSTIFLFVAFFLFPYGIRLFLFDDSSITACNLEKIRELSCDVDHNDERIPNIAHFVYVLEDPTSDFPFQFSHYLSIYSAKYYWRPEKIYLHVNADIDGDAVSRAKNGLSGKWTQLIFNMPGLHVNTVEAPTHAGNGEEVGKMEHRSDFVRVKAVHDYGGVYIDLDVYPLRDIGVLRDTGYRAITGRQIFGEMNSGTFMSEKGGALMKGWMKRMHEVYDGAWVTHSNVALTEVGEQLVKKPCEILVMGQEAFAPVGWQPDEVERLYGVHEDDAVAVDAPRGSPLPMVGQNIFDSSVAEEHTPAWACDWSCTFLLHAFAPNKPRDGVTQNEVTPRYVLSRRSNLARAVYPVAKDMYDRGIIDVEDLGIL